MVISRNSHLGGRAMSFATTSTRLQIPPVAHKTETASVARPRVSIGIPVFNGERFLAETIDSILTQTFEDYEIIISDNASTDRTQEICLLYASRDQRIRYYRNESNLGGSENYNRVFRLSRG